MPKITPIKLFPKITPRVMPKMTPNISPKIGWGIIVGLFCLAMMPAQAEERLAPPEVRAAAVEPPPMVARPDFLQGLDLKQLKLYFKHISAKQFKQAAKIKSVASRPILREYAQLMRFKDPHCNHDYEAISAFIAAHPHWPFQTQIRKNAECSMPNNVKPKRVLEIFADSPPISAEGQLRLIEALFAVGEKDRAVAAAKNLWREGNFGRSFERRFIRGYSRHWGREDNIYRLDRLLWEYKRSAALRTAYRLDKGYQRLAEARIALRRARGGVDGAISRVPPALRDDEGLNYERFRWRVRKNKENAVELIQDMDCDLKKPSFWARQRVYLVHKLERKGEFAAAAKIAATHCQNQGGHYAELEWLAGKNVLKSGHRAMALSHFTRSHTTAVSVPGRARAAYWAGKVLRDGGNDQTRSEQWLTRAADCGSCFYGQLALKDLGRKITPTQTPLRPPEEEFLQKSRLLLLSRLLVTAGRAKEIAPFFYALFKENETVQVRARVIDLADSYGRPDLAVRLANKSRYGGGDTLWGGYPVLAHEDYSGVEEPLVLALIRQESAFMVRAASHAGAKGLMQVMPATARQVGKQIGLAYSHSRLSGDAVYNMKMGSAYLRMLLNRYDDSYPLALAAYNAGPGRVDRWLRENPPQNALDWVESIPISETKNYVKEVLSALNIYRSRLGVGGEIKLAWQLN